MPMKEARLPEPSAAGPELVHTPAPTPLPAHAHAPTTGMAAVEQHPEWLLISRLPLRLTARIPLPSFRVKNLVALKAGDIIKSTWASSDDVPLRIGDVQLSWSEFEVVEDRMAVRLTRLA